MAETRHRTTIEIGVDDRQVRGLGRTLDEALSAKTVERFHRGIEKSTKALEKLARQQAKLVESMQRAAQMQERMARQMAQAARGGGGAARMAVATGIGAYAGTRAGQRSGGGYARLQGGVNRAGAAAIPQEGFIAQALGGIPFVGGFLSGAINAAQGFAGHASAYGAARARAYGQTGLRGLTVGRRQATRMGYDVTAATPLLGQFAGAAGLRGQQLTDPMANAMFRMQGLMGLGPAQTGGFLGAARAGTGRAYGIQARGPSGILRGGALQGGGGDPAQLMQEAVASGMMIGVRDAKLGDFLQQIASFTERERTPGIALSSRGVLTMVRMIGSLGGAFRGRAGQRAVTGMMGALRGAGDRSSTFSMLAMQAAGFTGRPGGVSALEAEQRLEESPEMVLPNILRIINRTMGGGTQDARARAIRGLFQEGGHRLSVRQARQLSGMGPQDLQRRLAAARGAGGQNAQELLQGVLDDRMAQGAEGRRAMGTAAQDAALQNQRVSVGQTVLPMVRGLQRVELQMAGSAARMARSVFDSVRETMREWGAEIQEGGLGGFIHARLSGIADAVSDAIRTAVGGLLRRLGIDPDSVAERARSASGAGANAVRTATEATTTALQSQTAQQVLPEWFRTAMIGMVERIGGAIEAMLRNLPELFGRWLQNSSRGYIGLGVNGIVARILAEDFGAALASPRPSPGP